MKKSLIIILLFGTPMVSSAQLEETAPTSFHLSTLKYEPTIPADSTYTITKNTTGQPLTEEVKLEINLHRMKQDYLWRVNGEIEILIHGME